METVKLEIHVDEIKGQLNSKVIKALTKCGMTAEGYAKKLCDGFKHSGGTLKNSITYTVNEEERSVSIGSAMEYAAYTELGTGIYAEGGGGRPTPWVYKDEKGNWHRTHGKRPHPFIKPAVAEHIPEYKAIIKDTLRE